MVVVCGGEEGIMVVRGDGHVQPLCVGGRGDSIRHVMGGTVCMPLLLP